MSKYFKIAWRNLWRNSRRTIITSSSVFFGVFFACFMTSMQKGSFENMIGNMARFYSGYIQIQHPDYKETPSLNNSLLLSPELEEAISKNKDITHYQKRLETFALASNGEKSFPSIIFGINPQKEDEKSSLSSKVEKGKYLENQENALMIGKVLAKNLNINVGDSLILFGQGYHGVSAVNLYRVGAILDMPVPELNKSLIYMNLPDCQEYCSVNDQITSVVLMVKNTNKIKSVEASLKPFEDENTKIFTWDKLMPEILNLIEGKESSSAMVKSLLFMIIGFGVWATIIMLMHERKRELAVMIAIGFQKTALIFMMLIESFLIGILGILGGLGVSYGLLYYLYKNPITVVGELAETYRSMGFEPKIMFSISPEIFYNPAITVFVIFLLVSLYQIFFVAKLKVSTSVRS